LSCTRFAALCEVATSYVLCVNKLTHRVSARECKPAVFLQFFFKTRIYAFYHYQRWYQYLGIHVSKYVDDENRVICGTCDVIIVVRSVASLGLVSPGVETQGVTPIFS